MTKVNLKIEDKTFQATLNDSVSAQDLISKLPYRVCVNRSVVDYCGRLPESLKNDSNEAQRGWKNGDISYIPGDDWIAFFFDGESGSSSDTNPQHIIGHVESVKELNAWPSGKVEILIEKVS